MIGLTGLIISGVGLALLYVAETMKKTTTRSKLPESPAEYLDGKGRIRRRKKKQMEGAVRCAVLRTRTENAKNRKEQE